MQLNKRTPKIAGHRVTNMTGPPERIANILASLPQHRLQCDRENRLGHV